ncbi:MAG: exo-alpha-sialidase, partial [bacterium]|nr:exo-alpha-sialidase [bacterium]
ADFVFGDDRPFKQCHASTVVQAGNGDFIAAWFGGTEEKDPDVGIWMSRFAEGSWTAPELAVKVNETAHWNPVLFRDPARDDVCLFFKVGPRIPRWQTYWISSKDNGKTWSKAVELVPGDEGGRGPVKNKAIVLSDGAWLAPASTELGGWDPFADRSEDGGKTWSRSEDWAISKDVISGKGAIQPTFWESDPGKVHALMRTTAGVVARADSEDGGKTWTPVRASGLPNNNSGIDCLGLEDGRVLLVYNPVGKNWGARTPLNLAVSSDNGEIWRDIASLEYTMGEYSYPGIVRTKNGVAICYTWKRERVRCWQVPLGALE